MNKYRLSKQANKILVRLEKPDKKTGERIQKKITQLSNGKIQGESFKGARDYSKVRVGKYRIISTQRNGILFVFVIEKRETVYQTFAHLLKNV